MNFSTGRILISTFQKIDTEIGARVFRRKLAKLTVITFDEGFNSNLRKFPTMEVFYLRHCKTYFHHNRLLLSIFICIYENIDNRGFLPIKGKFVVTFCE